MCPPNPPVQRKFQPYEAQTRASAHQERVKSCLTKVEMNLEKQWEGGPGALDETCTESQWMADALRVRLPTVEEFETLTLEIPMPMKM